MGDISIKGRSPLLKGGRVGFKQGGAYGPLRGTSGPKGVAKAFRGKEGFKESQKLQKKLKEKSFSKIQRRAKYLILKSYLGNLIIHLGMSGSLKFFPEKKI